jgi:hypothetical protein
MKDFGAATFVTFSAGRRRCGIAPIDSERVRNYRLELAGTSRWALTPSRSIPGRFVAKRQLRTETYCSKPSNYLDDSGTGASVRQADVLRAQLTNQLHRSMYTPNIVVVG